jgi:hypothetical protein
MSFSVKHSFSTPGNAVSIRQVGVASLIGIRNYSGLRYINPSFRAFYPTLPSLRDGGLTAQQLTDLNDYLLQYSVQSSKSIHMMEIEGPATGEAGLFSSGAVYAPSSNRIYFIPTGVPVVQDFYYIDCETGSLQLYTNDSGVNVSFFSYRGGAYAPTLDRIYFGPLGQSDNTSWHYIDCSTGEMVAYEHGYTLTDQAYTGVVYAPTLDRLYLIPHFQAEEPNWHYIDGSTGEVIEYFHGGSFSSAEFLCGVYSPTENRMYLIPRLSGVTSWYYIDGNTGSLESMSGSFPSLSNDPFSGATYTPTLNRIYLIPSGIASNLIWYYIDCTTGMVIGYLHGQTDIASNDYSGGVYSPVHNRIYFVPNGSALAGGIGMYLDCEDETIYTYSFSGRSNQSYNGGVYSPTENRIYLARFFASPNDTKLMYLNELGQFPIDRGLIAHPMFGSYV